MDSAAERVVADLGARRRGIVVARQAHEAGLTRANLGWLRHRGLLVPLGRGVDRLRDHPFSWECRLQAALDLAGPGAVASLRSAARLHGFYRYRDSDAIEVMVPRARDHRLALGRLVQTRSLPAAQVTRVEGFAVTTVARTCFDLAGDPPPYLRGPVGAGVHAGEVAQVFNDALARRGLTFVNEVTVLAAIGKRGRRGTGLVRTLLLRFGPEYTPTYSDTEWLFAELVELYGLPEPQRQVPISGNHGFIGVVDFCWSDQRVVVEIDSSWHDGPLDRLEDRRRDEQLEDAGYAVHRFRYGQLIGEPAALMARLRHDLARSPAPTGGS